MVKLLACTARKYWGALTVESPVCATGQQYCSVAACHNGCFWEFLDKKYLWQISIISTGKSLSEALFLASTNPQYDERLFIELWVQYMKIASSEHVENMFWAWKVLLKKIYLYISTGVRSWVSSPFSRCTPVLDWSE